MFWAYPRASGTKDYVFSQVESCVLVSHIFSVLSSHLILPTASLSRLSAVCTMSDFESDMEIHDGWVN